jgi:aldehyde:ferredoxin oxidoreductase
MDTISTAGCIAFAMELSEKGMWDSGIEFGRYNNLSQVFDDIAHRRGIGEILAEGTKRMAEKFGGSEFAIHSKGMELSAYEPRGAVGQGLGYATSNRGGCHLNAGYLVVVEGLGLDVDALTTHGKAALAVLFQNLMEAISAAGSCLFTSYAVFPSFLVDKPNSLLTKTILAMFPFFGPVVNILNRHPGIASINVPLLHHTYAINAATGMKINFASMLKWGRYGFNTERVSNIILGQRAGADTLPRRLTDEEQIKGNKKTKVPLDKMKNTYYRIRGWRDGVPTIKAIKRAGMDLPEADFYPLAKGAK